MRTIPAGRFKAQCLRFLDEVANTGEAIVSRNIYATVLAHDAGSSRPTAGLLGTIPTESCSERVASCVSEPAPIRRQR
jgi:hypothetical protein